LQIENSIQANEIANAADALQLQDGSNSGDSSNLKKSNESSKVTRARFQVVLCYFRKGWFGELIFFVSMYYTEGI
jgi:hypothetical protein